MWDLGISERLNKTLRGKDATTKHDNLFYSNVSNNPMSSWQNNAQPERKNLVANDPNWTSSAKQGGDQPIPKPSSANQRLSGSLKPTTKKTKAGGGSKEESPEDIVMRQRKLAKQAMDKSLGLGLSEIDNLMAMLDPSYQKMQDDYQKTMEQNKQNDLNALTAQFAAYGTADSEQRNQAEERMRGDYGNKLSQFLSNLMAEKEKEKMGYQNKKLELQRGNYENQADLESKLGTTLANLKQNQFDNEIKLKELALKESEAAGGGSGSTKNDSLTKVGVKSDGTPVWYNNRTKQYVSDLPNGTMDSISELDRLLLGIQQGSAISGGQNQVEANAPYGYTFTGRYESGKPVYADSLGNEGIFE